MPNGKNSGIFFKARRFFSEKYEHGFSWGGDSNSNSPTASQWTPPKKPSAMTVFGKDADRSLFKKLLSITGEPDRSVFHEKGGHFPAMEIPNLFVC